MKDKDGFYILRRREQRVEPDNQAQTMFAQLEESTAPKKQKPKKPKLKKRWMKDLYHKLKDWRPMRQFKSFSESRLFNFTLHVPDGGCFESDVRFSIPKRRFVKRYKSSANAMHFIDCGDGMFMKISTEAYLKLLKIDRMILRFTLTGMYDSVVPITEDVDCADLFDHEYVFTHMGELCSFINYHRQLINGIYDIQSACFGFTDYWFDFHIVVKMQDGSVKTYHSNMNDFMKDFGLLPF